MGLYLAKITLWEKKAIEGDRWQVHCTEEGHSDSLYPLNVLDKIKKEYLWKRSHIYKIKNS